MLTAVFLFSTNSSRTFSLYNKHHFLSLKTVHPRFNSQQQLLLSPSSSSCSTYFGFTLPRVSSIGYRGEGLMNTINKRQRGGLGLVCYSAPLSPSNLHWISTISSMILMLARGTAIQKSFLVPIFVLQAPSSIISWMKGEYGIWAAFLALLLHLFLYMPGELELPFTTLLVVLVAPYQVMNLRGKQEGVIFSLAIAGYLAYQHFSRAGSLRKAFEQGSVIATIAIICVLAVLCLLLIRL